MWSVEANGINVVPDEQRTARPSQLFFIWCAANIGLLGLAYGAYLVAFYGLNLWQAVLAGALGSTLSFLLVGFVGLAGTKGGAPTMTLGRAAFGVEGNKVPALLSWVSLVGWETILVSLATLAAGTILDRLGLGDGTPQLAAAFAIIAAATIAIAMLGYDTILTVQRWFTWTFAALTVVYFVVAAGNIDLHAATSLPAGDLTGFVSGVSIVMAGLGLGWVNAGADYSRYLPRATRARSVVGWTTFGASIAPIVLIAFGVLVAASNKDLASAANPVSALADPLPVWFLVPYLVAGVGGLVAGAVMDIYSSGLNLLALGVRLPRHKSVLIDGVVMMAGTTYIVFFSRDFFAPFQGFLITLGVALAAWAAIFLADFALYRRRDGYAEGDLYDAHGRYGAVNVAGVTSFAVGTGVGLGLVTSTSPAFSWAGYLLAPVGGHAGTMGSSSLGLFIGFAVAGALYAALSSVAPWPHIVPDTA
jgi:nucleobase:cation symporter-1, NCS1 family